MTFCSYRGRQPFREGAETGFGARRIICAVRVSPPRRKGREYCTTPRRSGGWLPSQSFEFRNQMLECVEILDGRH